MSAVKLVTDKARRSMSLIEAGDTFVFNGLRGGSSDDGSDCLITVLGISVPGKINFSIQWIESDKTHEPSIASASYSLVSQLIEEQIWQSATLSS